MPYARPALTDLRQQAMSDISSSDLPNADGFLRKAVLRVLAWVQAGMAHLHYGFLDWIAAQSVPFSCGGEYLEAWAGLRRVTRIPPAFATGLVQFSGTTGVPVASGLLVQRGDGAQFVTIAGGTVSGGGTVTVPVLALVPGAAGNTDNGTTMSLANPIGGLNKDGVASGALTGGADQELDASLRARMLAAFAAPPQGGDRADYLQWTMAVPGVTRAWVAPNGFGPGTVIVYAMLDETESAHGGFPQGTNGVATNEPRDTPATGDQLTIANALFPQRPVTALVYACAPVAQPIDFSIGDLGSANTTAMQAQITAALQGMFLNFGNVGGTMQPDEGDAWPPIEPSAWYEALGAIPGLSRFTVGAPTSAVTASSGHLPVLGNVTFSS